MRKKKVSFWARKPTRIRRKVKFRTSDGKIVSFKANKVVNKEKEDSEAWKHLFIGLAIVFLIVVGYDIYNYFQETVYQTGYDQAILNIAIQQTTTGNIIYAYLNESNGTMVASENINKLCGFEEKE